MNTIYNATTYASKYKLIGVYLILFAILCSFYNVGVYGLDRYHALAYLFLAATAVILHLLSVSDRNWLRIDTLFISGFMVVNYQWPIMAAYFDITPMYSFQSTPLFEYGNYSMWLSTASLLCWLTGYSTGIKMTIGRRDALSGFSKVGASFLIAMLAFTLTAGTEFFSRDIYTESQDYLYQTIGGVASYLSIILDILCIILLSYISYEYLISKKIGTSTERISSKTLFGIALICAYAIIYLFGGERGQIVQIFTAIALVYGTNIRPITALQFVLMLIVGFTLFSMFGMYRGYSAGYSSNFLETYGIWEISSGFAQSVFPTIQAISLVNGNGDFFYGSLWVSQILGLIPFMQGFFLSWTGWQIQDISSSMQLTVFTFGSSPNTGMGTSFVADPYLNFGIGGIIAISFAHGIISRIMASWLTAEAGFVRFFCAVSFGSLAFYITRGSTLVQMQPIVWGVAIAASITGIRLFPARRSPADIEQPTR